jgi:hypothetical protein
VDLADSEAEVLVVEERQEDFNPMKYLCLISAFVWFFDFVGYTFFDYQVPKFMLAFGLLVAGGLMLKSYADYD